MSDIETSLETYVGARIRDRRRLMKLSQTELAGMLGISYQQLQKYENGSTALTLGRMMQMAQIMNVPPSFFYDGAPASTRPGDAPDSEVIVRTRTQPLQVLLVEDNSGDEILFRNAVEDSNAHVEVYTLSQADKVMDFLQNYESKYARPRPHLIVLDINLPRKDGLSLLEEIKGSEGAADIPVIMLTNSVRTKDMKESYRKNAAGFIQKSLDYQDFCDDVAAAMQYWSRAVVLPVM